MKRLTIYQKEKITILRNNGSSLYEISEYMNLGKTTVYYHLRKEFGRSFNLVNIDKSDEDLLGEIIGLFAGDGSSIYYKSKYYVKFHLSFHEKEYVKRLLVVLFKVFGKLPEVYEYGAPKNVIILRYSSKEIYELMRLYLSWDGKKTYSVKLSKLNHSRKFLIGFLRGYLDSDGYTRTDQRKIQFVTVCKDMANQISRLISRLGFESSIYIYNDPRPTNRPCFYVNIKGENAIQFIKLINPRNPRRLQGPVV